MAVDVTISNIGSGFNRTTINSNFEAIQQALQNAFDLNGNTPNSLNTDLDLDGNDLLNVNDATFARIYVDGEEVTPASLSRGYTGWSPSFGVVTDGSRRVLQLASWVNGTGDVPTDYIGQYIGTNGFVVDVANAVDIRGPQGATGPGSGDLVAAQNLSDVNDAATSFDNIKQQATTSVAGVAEVATASEAVAEVDGTKMITPLLMANFVPIGVVFDYAGTTAPTGWLFAYGQAVSRTTYSALFAIIDTTFGVGDGTTTFNLPDLRGRVVAGKDDMGGISANRLTGITGSVNGDNLGAAGGEEGHALTEAENGPHTHTYGPKTSVYGANGQSYSDFRPAAGDSNRSSVTLTTNSSGSGTAHNTVQPTLVLNKIMFVGV